ADQEAALRRRQTDARKAVLKAIDLGKIRATVPGAPTPALIANLQKRDQAEIDFYTKLAKTGKTAALRRHAKNELQKAVAQQKADNDAIIAAEDAAVKNRTDLALTLSQIAAETGKGTFAQAEAAQKKADAAEKKILTDDISRQEKIIADRSNGLKKRAAA